MLELGDKKYAEKWLTEDGWIVFAYGGDGFERYLENKYFTPGTPKNAEFEVLIGHLNTPEGPKIGFFLRIKDTKVNRRILKKAFEEYYRGKVHSKKLNEALKSLKREIHKIVKQLR